MNCPVNASVLLNDTELVDTGKFLLNGAGRATPQSLIGGLAVGDDLELSATSHAGGGLVVSNHPIKVAYSEGNTTPAEQSAIIWEETFTTAGAYLGQMLRNDVDISYTNAFYIYASVLDRSRHRAQVSAGFAGFTLFNALCQIDNDGNNVNLVQMLVLNDGGVHERNSAGTSTTPQHITVSSAPQLRTTVSGATMTWSAGAKGLAFAPKWSTVAGSTINMGTVCAVQQSPPAAGLFQPELGIENVANIRGFDFLAHTTPVSGTIEVVRSAMTAAASRYFLRNIGGAQSDMGGGVVFGTGARRIDADNVGLVLGAGQDVLLNWNGSALEFDPVIGDDFRIAFAAGQHTVSTSGAAATAQLLFAHGKEAHGQTSPVGNQKIVWAANAETITVAGEFAQYLLTQAANDTVDAALSGYFGWVINAPTPTIGTGSITTIAGLSVGGNMTGAGLTNKAGIRILSNPSGASGVNAALWVTAGLSRFDGRVDINNGVALGGGAAATLGTIGGSGPSTATQAQWVEIDIGGTAHWIPVWT